MHLHNGAGKSKNISHSRHILQTQAHTRVSCLHGNHQLPQKVELVSAMASAGAALVGLSVDGHLYWGSDLVAEQCTSAAIRDKGPGGPHLLWTTRASFLHCRPFASLLQSEVFSSPKPSRPAR